MTQLQLDRFLLSLMDAEPNTPKGMRARRLRELAPVWVKEYEAGKSLAAVAAGSGFSTLKVRHVLDQCGVVIRPSGGTIQRGIPRPNYVAAQRGRRA